MKSNDTLRRSMPVFPMSVVTKLSELSARQIRYYETHELVKPQRSEGNKRLLSINELERLLEIKKKKKKGFNIKGIKQIINDEQDHLTDDEQETRKQMIVEATQKPQREAIPINRGDLSRFIK